MQQNDLSKKLSIVIIARNRAESLARTLRHLTSFRETVPLILVDNHSEDSTESLIRNAYPGVDLLLLTENYGSAGRNIGVAHAQTSYIAFADDDSWWEEQTLRAAIEYFEQYPRLGLLQGKILLHEKTVEPACELMEKSPLTTPEDTPGTAILGFVACGAIVRKTAFLAAGGFHAHFGVGGEEALLALDMAEQGWHLAYVPNLIAIHNPSPLRNKARRKQLAVRNHLWTVWLRRSRRSILSETSSLLQSAITDKHVRAGMLEACAGLPWILKERKPLRAEVEQEVARLSRFRP